MTDMMMMRETKMITMRTFDKDGVLGAWEGDRGLVVWVKGSNNGDTPIEHQVQHPIIHTFSDFLQFGPSIVFLVLATLVSWIADTESRTKCQCHEKHFT